MVKPMIKKTLLPLSFVLSLAWSLPGAAAPVTDQHWSLLARQLFPALSDLSNAHLDNAVLAARRARIDACQQAPACLLNAGLWSEAEISELAAVADKAPAAAWRKPALADDGIPAQVRRELRGLNGILQVYGLGIAPNYPLIDGPVDTAGSQHFNANVADAVAMAKAGADDPALALDPSLQLAVALLDANGRDDAVAFEPLDPQHKRGGTGPRSHHRLETVPLHGIDYSRHRPGKRAAAQPAWQAQRTHGRQALCRRRGAVHHPQRRVGASARHSLRGSGGNAARADRALWRAGRIHHHRTVCAPYHHQPAQRSRAGW